MTEQPGRGVADHWLKDEGADQCVKCHVKYVNYFSTQVLFALIRIVCSGLLSMNVSTIVGIADKCSVTNAVGSNRKFLVFVS